MTKNRKSFITVIQAKQRTARVYRIKQNIVCFLGFMQSINLDTLQTRNDDAVKYLKYNGHVLANHAEGVEFTLTFV